MGSAGLTVEQGAPPSLPAPHCVERSVYSTTAAAAQPDREET